MAIFSGSLDSSYLPLFPIDLLVVCTKTIALAPNRFNKAMPCLHALELAAKLRQVKLYGVSIIPLTIAPNQLVQLARRIGDTGILHEKM